MSLALDAMPAAEARAALRRCCGAERWVEAMLAGRPFGSAANLYSAADQAWSQLERDDYLEAFAHHPRIGADLDALREKFGRDKSGSTKGDLEASAKEQAGALSADPSVLRALSEANIEYESRFGHVFLVCATGKSATEMLDLVRARMHNDPAAELKIAAEEQARIFHLRLQPLTMSGMPSSSSPITTHVLDTAQGKPAANVAVTLEFNGKPFASGVTDQDGRVTDLLSGPIDAGGYRLRFAVGEFFARTNRETLFGDVVIDFVVNKPDEHYHVPLLLSPFGYSTYRGS